MVAVRADRLLAIVLMLQGRGRLSATELATEGLAALYRAAPVRG